MADLPLDKYIPDNQPFSYSWERFLSGQPDFKRLLDFQSRHCELTEEERSVLLAFLLASKDAGTWCGIPDVGVNRVIKEFSNGISTSVVPDAGMTCKDLHERGLMSFQKLRLLTREKTMEHDKEQAEFMVWFPNNTLVIFLAQILFTTEPDPRPPDQYL